jgi:hypothetical protein
MTIPFCEFCAFCGYEAMPLKGEAGEEDGEGFQKFYFQELLCVLRVSVVKRF